MHSNLENTLLSDKEWDRLRNDVQQAERELMALDNLIETKAVFQALTERDDLTCIVPDKLYFYSKNEGQGESLESEDATVYLKYTISNPSEEILIQENSTINLRECILGFRAALKGMKVGEKRLI